MFLLVAVLPALLVDQGTGQAASGPTSTSSAQTVYPGICFSKMQQCNPASPLTAPVLASNAGFLAVLGLVILPVLPIRLPRRRRRSDRLPQGVATSILHPPQALFSPV